MTEPWVLDLDGVIWIGDEPIAGAADAVSLLQESGREVWFVTNMSALPVTTMEAKLARHGIAAEGRVVTSAMAAARLVDPGERVMVVGGSGINEAVEARGATIIGGRSRGDDSVDDGAAVDVVVVGIDPAFNYDEMARAMTMVRAGARLVGTNHDPSYPTPDGLKPGGGAIVEAIAYAAEVRPIYAGKPNSAVAALVRDLAGPTGLMVGDRPDSDGLFAEALGYRFGLVLSGVTSADDLPVTPTPDLVADSLAAMVADHAGG